MKRSIATLVFLSLAFTDVSANVDLDLADAKDQCYRSLRAFVREVYPDHVFDPRSRENWKPVESSEKKILKIEAEDYIKIKPTLAPEYKSHKVFCSYYKPTMTVISVGVSPPADPE